MGTSQSSGGPGPNVPLVPPWTPPPPKVPPPQENPQEPSPQQGQEDEQAATQSNLVPAPPSSPQQVPLAPAGRFREARANLGRFAHGGTGDDLSRALGHYVRKGYGGAGTAAQRFGGTIATAGAFGQVLANLTTDAGAATSGLDRALLGSRSADAIMDAVVEAVRPTDGTQDAEAEREAIRDALSEMLEKYPDADLLNLDDDQRAFAIEEFTASDVYRRFDLDVGQTITEKAPTAVAALARLKEVRDYIRESVAASFRELKQAGKSLTTAPITQVVRDALRQTLEVFEGYAE